MTETWIRILNLTIPSLSDLGKQPAPLASVSSLFIVMILQLLLSFWKCWWVHGCQRTIPHKG